MTIVIVGAGVGGLAAALSLHEAGLRDVRVFERVAEIAAGYKRAAGFHPDALNSRASLTPPGASR